MGVYSLIFFSFILLPILVYKFNVPSATPVTAVSSLLFRGPKPAGNFLYCHPGLRCHTYKTDRRRRRWRRRGIQNADRLEPVANPLLCLLWCVMAPGPVC